VFGLLLRACSLGQADPLAGSARLQPVVDEAVGDLPQARVLYVEDNAMNAELMVSLFAMRPSYRLMVVDTACRALAVAREFQPDLLLLDMQLPDMDGRQLLQSLRQLLDDAAPGQPAWSRVPAVALSADAVAEHVAQARAVGFNDYWTKPLDVPRLLPCLDGLLRTRLAAGGTMSV
jgi:CheY-like chemotaxis protein